MQGCSERALTTSVQLSDQSSAPTALHTVSSLYFSPAADCEQQQQAVKVVEVWFSSNSLPHTLRPVLVLLFAKYKASHINGPILHRQVLFPHCTSPRMVVPASHRHCPFLSQMFWHEKSYGAYVFKNGRVFLHF